MTARIDPHWIELVLADFGGVSGDGHTHATTHDPFAMDAADFLDQRERHHGTANRCA